MKTIFTIGIVITLIGCNYDRDMARYSKLADKELSTGRRVDSVFFGIHFGMKQKDFFSHCMMMNKKGIFTDGNDHRGNMNVLYKLNSELKYPASMNFYPDFNHDSIWKVRVNFHYTGWVPWNKSLNADSLLLDVLTMFNKWYKDGNSFLQIKDEKRGTVYVKVDGNRRIAIRKLDDMMVTGEITDMPVEQQLKENR